MAEKINVIELSKANAKELEIKLEQQQQLIAKLEEDILMVHDPLRHPAKRKKGDEMDFVTVTHIMDFTSGL